MKTAQCFIVLGLCLIMWGCHIEDGILDIDIGDYEGQLAAWNSQNMLDYKLWVGVGNGISKSQGYSTVRNGISEDGSTIPEYYSYIKELEKKVEKNFKDDHDSGDNKSSISLKVSYNTEYHYPSEIITEYGGRTRTTRYTTMISLSPLGKLEIDIGDYEGQLAAWNSRNMLDYQFDVTCKHSFTEEYSFHVLIYVENGIIKRITKITPLSFLISDSNMRTIPEFYSFIKSRGEYFTDYYNRYESLSGVFNVSYDTEYHYPREIIMRGYDNEDWNITLTPGKTEQETEGGE